VSAVAKDIRVTPSTLKSRGDALIKLSGEYRSSAKKISSSAKLLGGTGWSGRDATVFYASLDNYREESEKIANLIEGYGIVVSEIACEYSKAQKACAGKAGK
jgi:uncharacterized protein YukE